MNQLTSAVNLLREDVNALTGNETGTVADFRLVGDNGAPKGLPTPDALGEYPAAVDAARKYRERYETVAATYDIFISVYEELIVDLEQMTGKGDLPGRHGGEDSVQGGRPAGPEATREMDPPEGGRYQADARSPAKAASAGPSSGGEYDLVQIAREMKPDVVESVAAVYVAVRDRVKASIDLIDRQVGHLGSNRINAAAQLRTAPIRDAARTIQKICDGVQRALYEHAAVQREFQRELADDDVSVIGEALGTVLESARREIRDFRRNIVELASGAFSTAGQVERDLATTFDAMRHTVMEMRALYHRQGSVRPEEFATLLGELTRRQNAHARKIDELSAVLRDAVDASAAARSVCEAQARLGDPDVHVDDTKSERITLEFGEALEEGRRAWHEFVDKHAGRLYRIPSGTAEVDDLAGALQEFEAVINDRITAEQSSNQLVLAILEEVQRRAESTIRMHRVDPRVSVTRPIDIRDVLRDMYSDERTSA